MNESLRKNLLFIKWFLVFLLFETTFLLSSYNKEFFGFKILINYLLVLLILPLIYERYIKGRIDIFSPIVIVVFFYFIIFIITSIDLLYNRFYELQNEEKFYTYAILYSIISFHAFLIGYYSNLSKIFLKIRVKRFTRLSVNKVILITIFYSAISFASFFLIVKTSGGLFNYFENIKGSMVKLLTGSAFLYMGVILIKIPLLIWFGFQVKRARFSILFLVYFLIASMLLVFLGERGHFVFLVISLLVCYHYIKQRLKLIPVSIFALILYLFLLLYGQYRELGLQNTNRIVNKESYRLGTVITYKKLVENFDQLIRVKDIIKYVPEKLDYQYGKTFFNLLFKPIPSRIWPEKPQGAGYYVTKSLYPKHFTANASIATSLLGELYLNFHVVGIIVGMFLFGLVVSAFYKFLAFNLSDFNVIIIYSLSFPYFFSELRGDFAVVTLFYIFEFIFLIIALNFISKKNEKTWFKCTRVK
jgi:oligosaccharide repeat unit polymerase